MKVKEWYLEKLDEVEDKDIIPSKLIYSLNQFKKLKRIGTFINIEGQEHQGIYLGMKVYLNKYIRGIIIK